MDIYLHGRCHLFALALHEVFSYPIEFFWETNCIEDGEEYGEVLVHAYVIKNGICVDIEGPKNRENIEADFDWNEPIYVSKTKEQVVEMINSGLLEPAADGEMEILRHYILTNLSKYQI